MTKQPRSSKPIGRQRPVPAPAHALRAIEAAALKDLSSGGYALDLYDALIGAHSGGVFPRHAWCLSPDEDLPGRMAAAARALIKWAVGRNLRLNEVAGSRIRVLEAIVELRRNSPYGQRCLQVANTLREKYPSAQPNNVGQGTAASTGVVPVIESAIGRPVNELTIQLVQALGPSEIRIAGRGDPMPRGLKPGAATIWLGADGYTVEEITWSIAIPVKQAGERIEGVLYDFFETGAEGMMWSLIDDDNLGREGLHFIEAADHLTICDSLGQEQWSGTIRCDRRSGWRPYPGNPEHGQPVALGCWIHWTQKGFTPDQWARFFMRPDVDRFRGILRKAKRRS
jgi:hypothetical protein